MQPNDCGGFREIDGEPLRCLVRANLAAVIGQSALVVDHDKIGSMENWGEPLQRPRKDRTAAEYDVCAGFSGM